MSKRTDEKPSPLRAAVLLVLLGLVAAVLLAGLNRLTRERIDDERRHRALAAVSSMLETGSYDNELLEDSTRLPIPGLSGSALVYRARKGQRHTAAVFDVTTSKGYSGDIRLLVAIDTNGAVLGVRVLEHRETPGLGDKIERGKTDWLEQFEGRKLGMPPAEDWAPDRRDGAFDTVTSATITSAAVINAVKHVLQAFEARRENLFARTENTDETE